jgi:hypothetical protein
MASSTRSSRICRKGGAHGVYGAQGASHTQQNSMTKTLDQTQQPVGDGELDALTQKHRAVVLSGASRVSISTLILATKIQRIWEQWK